jgi:adenosine deaminase CECR1
MPTNKEKPTGFLFSLLTRQINSKETRAALIAKENLQAFDRFLSSNKTWTSVQSYEEACTALIAKENSQAFDRQAVATASDIEKQANKLISAIRKEDQKEIYNKDKRQQVVAGHFLSNVNLINKTELLKVAKKMLK